MNNPVAVLDSAYRFGPPTLVDVTTSLPTDADVAPTWQVYEDGSAMGGQSGTLSKLGSNDGVYEGTITPTAANGFDSGKGYTILITAQVDGVVGYYKVGFVIDARVSTRATSQQAIDILGAASTAASNSGSADTRAGTLLTRLGDPSAPAGSTIAKQLIDTKEKVDTNLDAKVSVAVSAVGAVSLIVAPLGDMIEDNDGSRFTAKALEVGPVTDVSGLPSASEVFSEFASQGYSAELATQLTTNVDGKVSEISFESEDPSDWAEVKILLAANLDGKVSEAITAAGNAVFGISQVDTKIGDPSNPAGDTLAQMIDSMELSGGGQPISPRYEQDGHIWRFSHVGQLTGRPTVIEQDEYDGLLIMDLSNVLSSKVRIYSAELVESPSADITVEEPLLLSPDGRKVHIVVETSTPGTYTFQVRITTTDDQTFTRLGVLQIR